MTSRFTIAMIAGAMLVSAVAAQTPVRVDSLGDPLPEGAVARLGTRRMKINATQAVFSRDGKIIAAANSPSGTRLCLWDAATGKAMTGPWLHDKQRCEAFALSPDATVLAVASHAYYQFPLPNSPSKIELWDIAHPKLVQTIHCEQFNSNLVFTDNGQTILSETNGMVRAWDVASGKRAKSSWTPIDDNRKPLDTTHTWNKCVFSPDGKYVAAYHWWYPKSAEVQAIVADLSEPNKSWHITKKNQGLDFVRFGFSSNSNSVAILLGRNEVQVRDRTDGKVLATPRFTDVDWHSNMCLSSDGRTLAITGDACVHLWSVDKPDKVRTFHGRIPQAWVPSQPDLGFVPNAMAFSPDGKRLLVGVDSGLQLFDVAALKEVFTFDGHRDWVNHLRFSADGKKLHSNAWNTEIGVWETASWQQSEMKVIGIPKQAEIGSISSDHRFYTGAKDDDRWSIYDYSTKKLLGRLPAPPANAETTGGFSTLRSEYYLHGEGHLLEDWNLFAVPTGKLICKLGPTASRRPLLGSAAVAFSSDGRLLARAARSSLQIGVFDLATGQLRQQLGHDVAWIEDHQFPVACLAFSSDKRYLACWTCVLGSLPRGVFRVREDLRIWDLHTAKEQLCLPIETKGYQTVDLAFSHDGRMLAVAVGTKIQLWELSTRKLRHTFNGHDSDIRSLAFSPDGRYLASGSADTTVLIWDVWRR